MISIVLGVILLACSAYAPAPDRPDDHWYYYFDWKAEAHLRAMTRELLKDVELKMRYADFIFASYGGKVDPEADKVYSEVGYLDSQIQKKFRYMLATYRLHTELSDFMRNKFNEDDMLNGNHLIQSAYHEILVLKDLQNKALDKQEAVQKKERAMQFFMEFNRKEKTYKPSTRSKGSRGPARRHADGDSNRNRKGVTPLDMKTAEIKLRKKKWMEGHGMNDSIQMEVVF